MTTKKALIIKKDADEHGLVLATGDEAEMDTLNNALQAWKSGTHDTVQDLLDAGNLHTLVVGLTTVVGAGAILEPDSDVFRPVA